MISPPWIILGKIQSKNLSQQESCGIGKIFESYIGKIFESTVNPQWVYTRRVSEWLQLNRWSFPFLLINSLYDFYIMCAITLLTNVYLLRCPIGHPILDHDMHTVCNIVQIVHISHLTLCFSMKTPWFWSQPTYPKSPISLRPFTSTRQGRFYQRPLGAQRPQGWRQGRQPPGTWWDRRWGGEVAVLMVFFATEKKPKKYTFSLFSKETDGLGDLVKATTLVSSRLNFWSFGFGVEIV